MENFKIGLEISRAYKTRTETETELLNEIILSAIELIHNDDKNKDKAINFLITIYEPLIKRSASKVYNKFKTILEFEDVLQECYLLFLKLINKFKINEAPFSWYINYFLPQTLYVWGRASKKNKHVQMDFNSDIHYDHAFSNYNRDSMEEFDFYILEKEYIKFMEDRAIKKSKSETTKIVCEKFFLGGTNCTDISHDIGISYQAVYEIINRIKSEFKIFLQESKYSPFIMTSTGYVL
jgi:DNA-directed RNA polymerase specialized sigma subunit